MTEFNSIEEIFAEACRLDPDTEVYDANGNFNVTDLPPHLFRAALNLIALQWHDRAGLNTMRWQG